jgi:4-alpha-glucanotransferase
LNRVFTRSSGILMHISSLPGPWESGDFGNEAFRFIDKLHASRQSLWQILPLAIPDASGSPYASISAFAGNPLFINPERLVEEGLIPEEIYKQVINSALSTTDKKRTLLREARMHARSYDSTLSAYAEFIEKNRYWLPDYARFKVLNSAYTVRDWTYFPEKYKWRYPEALALLDREHHDTIQQLMFEQFLFNRQWHQLKEYAHARHVLIVGDIPIFISHHSADVWSHPDLFKLDDDGRPYVVAGVPPDLFSDTGQLWRNPHYRWDRLKETGYSWWIHRLEHLLEYVDYIRLDHFRGFESVWEIKADEKTAENGVWVPSAGHEFFHYLKEHLGILPIIAEDLGVITDNVRQLRDDFGFPGMKILQFAFDSDDNPFLPENFETDHCIVYSGTHDNNTTLGWFRKDASPEERKRCLDRLKCSPENVAFSMVRYGMESRAVWMITPIQDILGLDERARMNFPGTTKGNWKWRTDLDDFNNERIKLLKKQTEKAGRI